MRNTLFEEEKGLFTFYKQQEQLEELQSKYNSKLKKKPSKPSKLKRKMNSHIKSTSNNSYSTIINNQEESPNINRNQLPLHKHKKQKKDTLASHNKNKKSILQRIKTQPNQILTEPKSIKIIDKIKLLKKPQNLYRSLSPTTSDLLKNYQKAQLKNHDLPKNVKKQFMNPKMAQNFKSLQIKRQALISEMHSLHLNNKPFFKEQKSPHKGHQSSYILLKGPTKLPNIKQQISPQSLQRILVKAVKNTPYQRKELKVKYQNLQRKQLFKFNLMAQLSQQKYFLQSGQLSLINLNKSYKEQQKSYQQWELKKRLIKSRLGIQL